MPALQNQNLYFLSQDRLLDPGNSGYTVSHMDVSVTRNTFEVGDSVHYTDSDGGQFGGTYIGRDENGIVVRQFGGPDLYFSDQSLARNTEITIQAAPYPVCFLKGTRLDTQRGQVAIEELIEGDRVRSVSGWKTVTWIGWRTYDARALAAYANRMDVAPVRIKAGALCDDAPTEDLSVSPWHHLLVEGQLVRAKDLVNGITIVQDIDLEAFEYFHVELETFDLVMAHGVYTESWADGGNRDFFQNADVASLRPEDMTRRRAARPGYDHLVQHKGKTLQAIQKAVSERAHLLGQLRTATAKAA